MRRVLANIPGGPVMGSRSVGFNLKPSRLGRVYWQGISVNASKPAAAGASRSELESRSFDGRRPLLRSCNSFGRANV